MGIELSQAPNPLQGSFIGPVHVGEPECPGPRNWLHMAPERG